MTAEEILKQINTRSTLNTSQVIEAMKAYAEAEREKAFNEARVKKNKDINCGCGCSQCSGDKYSLYQDYAKQNPLI